MPFHNIFSKKKNRKKKQIGKLKIIVDNRERNSLVISELLKLNFQINYKQLPVADYIINNTAIERKTLSDFKSSIINKRLTKQLLEIKQYAQHFLILEGLKENDLYNNKGLHENAARGFLLTTILEHNVPIIFSQDEEDTAKFLYVLAKKDKNKKQYEGLRASKLLLSDKERLQFILEGFPGIGPVAAEKLLKKYKTLKNLANASLQDLQEIIGKKAETLHSLFNQKY